MTGAPTPEALRTALAKALIISKFGPGAEMMFGPLEEATEHQRTALRARCLVAYTEADALIAGPLAPILKALADVERERDEAKHRAARANENREAKEHESAERRKEIARMRGLNDRAYAKLEDALKDRDATRAECDALKGEVERKDEALRVAEAYLAMALHAADDEPEALKALVVVRAALAQEARDG